MELSLNTRRIDNVSVVDVAGEVDVSTSPRLREELVGAVSNGGTRLVVNMAAVEFIDSTGLGVLVGVLKRVRSRDGRLSLVCGESGVLRVFSITGLEKVFAIYGSVDEAVAALA